MIGSGSRFWPQHSALRPSSRVDLGVGLLFGLREAKPAWLDAERRCADLGRNETWLVVTAVMLWALSPFVYATLAVGVLSPPHRHSAGLILRGVAFEFRYKTPGCGDLGFELRRRVR